MTKKLVSALLIAALIATLIPFTTAANAPIPAFTNFDPSETTIGPGGEITITIGTLTTVTHVFTEVDGTRINAAEQTQPAPATGTRNWMLTITPQTSQSITVYANTANHTQGAAAITLHIVVEGGGTGETLTPVISPFMDTVPPHERSNMGTQVTVNIAGTLFTNAIVNTLWSNENTPRFQLHNLNRQFSTLTGYIGRVDGTARHDGTITFIGDGRQLAIFQVGMDDLPREVSVDVTDVSILRIYFAATGRGTPGTRFALANATIATNPNPPPSPTANLGRGSGKPFVDAAPPFERNNMGLQATASVAGVQLTNAIINTQWSNATTPRFQIHNLGGQYRTLTGVIGRVDGTARRDGTITFIGDGRQLASFTIGMDDIPREVSIDVTGVTLLRIYFAAAGSGTPGTRFVFANSMIE